MYLLVPIWFPGPADIWPVVEDSYFFERPKSISLIVLKIFYVTKMMFLQNLLWKWSTPKHKIFWFNIPMNIMFSVKKFNCTKHLCPQIHYCRNIQYRVFCTHYFHFCFLKIETVHQVFSKVFGNQNVHFLCDMLLYWNWTHSFTIFFVKITVNCLIWHVSQAICKITRVFDFVINVPFLFQLWIFVVTMLSFENNFFIQVFVFYQINMTKGTIAKNVSSPRRKLNTHLISFTITYLSNWSFRFGCMSTIGCFSITL